VAHQLLNACQGHASAGTVHSERVAQVVDPDVMQARLHAGRSEGAMRALIAAQREREDELGRPAGLPEPVGCQDLREALRNRHVADAGLGFHALLLTPDRDPPLGQPDGAPVEALRLADPEPGISQQRE
jgi:hypothetical protein